MRRQRSVYVNEFFNARSMLTPGIAGATTMMITSSLVSAFGWPANYVALVISLLVGLVAMSDETVESLPLRVLLYALNSLVIFSTAYGLNAAGVEAFAPQERLLPAEGAQGFFKPWRLFD